MKDEKISMLFDKMITAYTQNRVVDTYIWGILYQYAIPASLLEVKQAKKTWDEDDQDCMGKVVKYTLTVQFKESSVILSAVRAGTIKNIQVRRQEP